MLIEINDILPVSINAAYRTWQNRVLISKKGREFKTEITKLLINNNYEKILGPVEMSIEYFFKDKRCRDIDNYQKLLIDCMKDIVIEDDKMIYNLNLKKHIGCGFNKIIINIIHIDIEII
jgi:crossover junction endodeoxyribonuclease RusA